MPVKMKKVSPAYLSNPQKKWSQAQQPLNTLWFTWTTKVQSEYRSKCFTVFCCFACVKHVTSLFTLQPNILKIFKGNNTKEKLSTFFISKKLSRQKNFKKSVQCCPRRIAIKITRSQLFFGCFNGYHALKTTNVLFLLFFNKS